MAQKRQELPPLDGEPKDEYARRILGAVGQPSEEELAPQRNAVLTLQEQVRVLPDPVRVPKRYK